MADLNSLGLILEIMPSNLHIIDLHHYGKMYYMSLISNSWVLTKITSNKITVKFSWSIAISVHYLAKMVWAQAFVWGQLQKHHFNAVHRCLPSQRKRLQFLSLWDVFYNNFFLIYQSSFFFHRIVVWKLRFQQWTGSHSYFEPNFGQMPFLPNSDQNMKIDVFNV